MRNINRSCVLYSTMGGGMPAWALGGSSGICCVTTTSMVFSALMMFHGLVAEV
jgi:hypothetical protein